ncbi:threonine--tRNA ligase [Fastidiosibacter lacustris]|uniref:threonine--tRNA ligase n=1 Tax=Fastidiosibacter lacustris TaxID=2056695 RepID=UPI000E3412D6|nr:threonine--tRNA ligase [Fastidiosibacter lacustris]
MPVITLPDGSKRTFDGPVSVYNIALDIGSALAKATLAGIVDGKEVDTSFIIENDATLTLITAKDEKGLEILRHSCAHLLAQAVKQLYPTAQVTIGPVIENGFYYDFSYERAFTPEDLEIIEKRMTELTALSQPVTRSVKSRDDAITYFEAIGEKYKAEIIADLSEDEVLSLYSQGDFTDLCRGPHVPNTSYLKAFKLMRVAGAYWRGDSNNETLTRIYGTCWADKKQLKEYLIRLEEAEKRDHRKIGKALDLFHFQEESPGIAFWHPKGTAIWRVVEDYMRASNTKFGCSEIRTPLIADISMWEKSGHAAKYSENMFMTHSENRQYAIRPMNCPTCVQVYNHSLHSYRDLPIRMAEFGAVHRNEASGALHGLLRVRSFTQDDGHIFCSEAQIESEVTQMVEQCFEVYRDFGFTEFDVKLALRPDNRVGSDEIWDKSEKALAEALNNHGVKFDYLPGEGAFYGPKIEFHLKDAIGRSWQCGTIQLDLSMPMRLGATYVDENSEKQVPVMLHRAIVGSLERFIGVLIEHYAGKLPVWLAPIQIVVVGISNKQDEYLQEVEQKLIKFGIRTQIDLRNEKIGFKIREHTLARVPFIGIAGEKEQSLGQITVRKQDGTDLGALSIDALCKLLLAEIGKKCRVNLNN